MRKQISYILLFAAITFGCVAHGPKLRGLLDQPTLESIVLSYDISEAQRRWDDEVKDEYPDAILVIAHGQTDVETLEWYAYPTHGDPLPVREVVANIREDHPDRHLVLLICNALGHELTGVENVSYAKDVVWVWPDSAVGVNIRDLYYPEGVGSFEEFEHIE